MITNAKTIKLKVERLIPKWKGRIYLIYNGIEPVNCVREKSRNIIQFRRRFIQEEKQILVGVVARLSPEKDPHLLLDALHLMPKELISRIKIIWVGHTRKTKILLTVNEKIKSYGLSENFYLLPETRMINIVYQAIDALALTSKREGFPNVVMEAFANKKPVIATDVGDVRALVDNEKSGWIVNSGDKKGLADAFIKLLNTNVKKRYSMGKIGFNKIINNYSADKLVKSTIDVYMKILCKNMNSYR